MQHILESQYNFRKNPSKFGGREIAILILKPSFLPEYIKEVNNFIDHSKLELLIHGDYTFNRESTLALYNDIFRFSDKDILFGYKWKDRKLSYMVSGKSHVFIVQGLNAQSLAEALKYDMRNTHGRLSIPDRKLDDKEFEELAIKNIIHVVDANETEIALRLFSSLES